MSKPWDVKKLDEDLYNSLQFTDKRCCPHCNEDNKFIIQRDSGTLMHDGYHFFKRHKEIYSCKNCHGYFSTSDDY